MSEETFADRMARKSIEAKKAKHPGYCWPTLGEPCGQCHRCTGSDTKAQEE